MLNKNGCSLSPWHMQKGFYADKSRKILTTFEGAHVSSGMLYRHGVRTFGSWDKALLACGLKPYQIRICSRPIRSHPEKLKELIHFLYRKKVSLNYRDVDKNSCELKRILYDGKKLVTSGRSIIRAAERNFGSWDNALKRCHIDPEQFQKRPKRTSNLSIMPHQAEWVKDNKGKMRKQLLYGEPMKTPELLLVEKYNGNIIENKFKKLKQAKGDILSDVLEAIQILDVNGFRADLPKVISNLIDGKYSEYEIISLFDELRSDRTLKDLLHEALC